MIIKYTPLLSAVLSLAAGFFEEEPLSHGIDQRILNGKNAVAGQFPYQALLLMTSNDGQNAFCGGSLIRNNYVLTAGHCCDNMANITVSLGLTKVSEDMSSYVVRLVVTRNNIILHEKYNPSTIANDICLLRLPQTVETNANISILALPTQQDTNPSQYNFQSANISGWGQTNNLEGLHNDLQYSTVLLKPHLLCSVVYYFINPVSTSQLCSGKIPYTGPCHGDSGGPLTVMNSSGTPVEIGLVSWGVGGCNSINAVVYTYVPAFVDWINQHLT